MLARARTDRLPGRTVAARASSTVGASVIACSYSLTASGYLRPECGGGGVGGGAQGRETEGGEVSPRGRVRMRDGLRSDDV